MSTEFTNPIKIKLTPTKLIGGHEKLNYNQVNQLGVTQNQIGAK